MRVLCSTTAGEGHFGPLRVLAHACRSAGHEVRVAAPASFAGTVHRAGLDHVPFAEPSADAMHAVFAPLAQMSTEEANGAVMAEVFGRLDAQAAFPDVQRVVRSWRPDVVLRDPAEFASLAAAEAAGIAHIEVAIAVAALMEWGLRYLTDPLAELDALAGLTHGTLLQAAAASPVFTLVPEAMDRAVGHSPGTAPIEREVIRFRARRETGPGQLPGAWGDPQAPLVYVTFGTIAGGLDHLRGLFTSTLHALSALPIRVLFTTGASGEVALTDVPANAHVEHFWPQDEVMPLAAAVVTHGGFGTTMFALSAGVPQVVVPLFSTDQYLNADAISALGAGVTIHGGPETTSAVASAVSRVLSESLFRIRAGQIAEQIAALPEASDVLDQIGRISDNASPRGGRWRPSVSPS